MNEKRIVFAALWFFFSWVLVVYFVLLNTSELFDDDFKESSSEYVYLEDDEADLFEDDIDPDKNDNEEEFDEFDLENDDSFEDETEEEIDEEKYNKDAKDGYENEADFDEEDLSIYTWNNFDSWFLLTSYSRQQLASFYVNYYQDFLWKDLEFDEIECEFEDEDQIDSSIYDDVIAACKAWIFRWDWQNFYPYWLVSLDEILIWAIRLMDSSSIENDLNIHYMWTGSLYVWKKSLENYDKNIISNDMLQKNSIKILTWSDSAGLDSLNIVQNFNWKKYIYSAIYSTN